MSARTGDSLPAAARALRGVSHGNYTPGKPCDIIPPPEGSGMPRSVLVLLVFAASLRGQVAGTISGFVKDQTGAIVPGAVVTAVLTGQQLTRSAPSDSTGFFNLLSMQPG